MFTILNIVSALQIFNDIFKHAYFWTPFFPDFQLVYTAVSTSSRDMLRKLEMVHKPP